jgi:hypothetical protein
MMAKGSWCEIPNDGVLIIFVFERNADGYASE